MDIHKTEKLALLDSIKAALPTNANVVVKENEHAFGAVLAEVTDGSATVHVTINDLSANRTKGCRLFCSLSAAGIPSRDFKQAQVRSVLKPKAIADAIVAMLKLSYEVEPTKATMLAMALDAVKAAAPDAPVQQHRDAFSASIYGDLMVIAVELRGEEVILTVRDRSRNFGNDTLSVTPAQDFDAGKFSEYIAGFVAGKREKYLKQQRDTNAMDLSDALARQLNDEYPLGCRGTHDPNKVVVDLGRRMTADQARQLGEFLRTLGD